MLLLQSLFISFQFLENRFKMQKKKAKFTTIINSKVANQFNSVQSLSHFQLFVTSWTAAKHQASLSFTNYQRLLKLMSIESVMQSNHLILCHPLLLLSSIFPSTMAFSNESVLHIRWPKYWSFSFSISPSKRIFRTDFL